MSHQKRLACKR